MALLRSAKASASTGDRPSVEFLMLALSGTGTFDKVIKMIDNMVALLAKEQTDDDDKKAYCIKQLDEADDKKKFLERTIATEKSNIASAEDSIATLSQEIAALEEGIRALDTSVAEATAQRKDENAEFKALIASNTAAKELLDFAKNRLNKFYNPKLYKAPPPADVSEEDRLYAAQGGVVTTAAPGGIAGTGITVFAQISMHSDQDAAPPPPPETWGAYTSKSNENTGVMAMIDLLIKDLDKDMTEAETEEKDAQADYETMMKESSAKRVADSKSLADKQGSKADTEAALNGFEGDKKDTVGELMATMKYIQSLHSECDWLVKYYDVRKEARAGEIDSLVKAKAVLSGADFSLLQTTKTGFLSRS